ncbi:hypothetical protein ASZ90_015991 [hydrocarbon metagenome]|uniref:Uncharacterized protein n=1 Tax=hydrocarbon metagenome TaxID=938273 RepID=A0A0W8F0M0_9ZZZZ
MKPSGDTGDGDRSHPPLHAIEGDVRSSRGGRHREGSGPGCSFRDSDRKRGAICFRVVLARGGLNLIG